MRGLLLDADSLSSVNTFLFPFFFFLFVPKKNLIDIENDLLRYTQLPPTNCLISDPHKHLLSCRLPAFVPNLVHLP